MQTAIIGIGCFWKETEFKKLKGVISTEVGYCGGNTNKTNYKKVCSYENLLRFFFSIHDPTTLNRQGPDIGTQYRSEIFYNDEKEKEMAKKIKDEINKKLDGKVVTYITKKTNYVRAEDCHQKYFEKQGIL